MVVRPQVRSANLVLGSANVWYPKGTQASLHGDSPIVIVLHAVSISAVLGTFCVFVTPCASLEIFV